MIPKSIPGGWLRIVTHIGFPATLIWYFIHSVGQSGCIKILDAALGALKDGHGQMIAVLVVLNIFVPWFVSHRDRVLIDLLHDEINRISEERSTLQEALVGKPISRTHHPAAKKGGTKK